MIHFTADPHFGHANVVKFNFRPFKTIEENDIELIRKWNSVVATTDTVVVCGDFIWPRVDPMPYLERLNGAITLIPGDHDHCAKDLPGVDVVDNIYNLRVPGLKDAAELIVCCHYPIYRWRKSHFGSWHVYGHVHEGQGSDIGKSLCVSVERWNYYPVSLTDLKEAMSILPDNPNLIRRERNVNPDTATSPEQAHG